MGSHHRDRSQHRQARLDGAERRHARLGEEQPRARRASILGKTGSFDQSGLLVTRSLLFSGEGSGLWRAGGGGNKLRAHDKKTGEVLHEFTLPANQSGVPMTYAVDGRQYIVVAVGARGHAGELVALALP